MVSVLVTRLNSPGSSRGQGNCIIYSWTRDLLPVVISHSDSLCPGVQMGTNEQISTGETLRQTSILSRGE